MTNQDKQNLEQAIKVIGDVLYNESGMAVSSLPKTINYLQDISIALSRLASLANILKNLDIYYTGE